MLELESVRSCRARCRARRCTCRLGRARPRRRSRESSCQRGDLGRVVRVERHADVEVAVADVAEDPARSPSRSAAARASVTAAGSSAKRHADVGRAVPETGPEPRPAVRGVVAGRPEPRARVGVALVDDLDGAFLLGSSSDELEIARRREPSRAGRLDEQARRLADSDVPAYVLIACMLQSRRPARAAARRHRPPRRRPPCGRRPRARGTRSRTATDVLRDPVEAQRQLGDHPERSLRADEQPGQVVAGRGLRRPRAGADHACRPGAPPRARGRSGASSRSEPWSSRRRSSPPCRRASRRPRDRRGTRARAAPAARSSADRVTPACTVAVRFSGSTERSGSCARGRG